MQERDDRSEDSVGVIVVISDRVDRDSVAPPRQLAWSGAASEVAGSYLHRLPLALIARGRFTRFEVWHHVTDPAAAGSRQVSAVLTERAFFLGDPSPPFNNWDMAEALRDAPLGLLLVYGLGVSADVIDAAGGATVIYNSIDAPALRIPADVSARCDIILTGAQWQAETVAGRHPGKPAPVLPVGPEFAAPTQFFPTGAAKDFDLIYVGAAQPYKRHDILFDAIERLDGSVSAVCVFGYGELAEQYREDAHRRGLPIEFVMPPVRSYAEVNDWMNRARIGVVAGFDDGAPAILTEYMLAGLPVLANDGLSCGLQYIVPETGEAAPPEDWHRVIPRMLRTLDSYSPRETAIARWSWPHSVARLEPLLDAASNAKRKTYSLAEGS